MPPSSPTTPGRECSRSLATSWITVLLAIAAGTLAAFQVGKVHIALPSIRQSFSLSLVSASWILSALSIVGLFTATPAGAISARIGNKRAIIIGLVLIAIASAAGGFSPSLSWLLISRFIEGIGFVMIVVAAPSLIVEVTGAENLRLALAGWAAYMPGGVALITLLAPLVLVHHTWRAVWWLNALVLLVAAIVIGMLAGKGAPQNLQPKLLSAWDELTCVLASRGPVLLAIIFGMYTMQHLSVMGFMPTLLHERFHLPEGRIGLLVAIAMASNIIGNLAAGLLLQRSFSRARIIAVTSIFMACMTVGMFVLHLPFPAFYACAFAFSCVGGLVPSAVMGAAPFHTPAPSLLGATNGLLVQGSNLGIVAGPPLMSLIATHLGWSWVPVMTGVSAILAAVLAANMRVTTHSNPEFFPSHLVD
jgi:MFS family permease